MPKHDIVVIGASSGGVDALRTLVSSLPKEFSASIFITVHTVPSEPGYLAAVLASATSLSVENVRGNVKIQHGHVYVAPPNLHLFVKRGFVQSKFLPKENGTRPAIDPMFRSAAHSYARRVIGVLLTGNLDDGTAGLGVIQDEGGITIVQDPKDALHRDMPLSALKSIKPDHVVPVSEVAPLLLTLVDKSTEGEKVEEENEIKETDQVSTCPGCGGVLHKFADHLGSWFQCMVGHRFNPETMVLEQNAVVEEYFWRLLSILKEKEEVARTMAADARAILNTAVDPDYFEGQAKASKEAQARINDLLDELGPLLFPGIPEKDV